MGGIAKNGGPGIVLDATTTLEYGYGMGKYGVGEEKIAVLFDTGIGQDGLTVVEDALRDWTAFFARHAL